MAKSTYLVSLIAHDHMICRIDDDKLAVALTDTNSSIELIEPRIIQIENFNQETGQAQIKFIPVLPPFVREGVNSVTAHRSSLMWNPVLVNGSMDDQYGAAISGILRPSIRPLIK